MTSLARVTSGAAVLSELVFIMAQTVSRLSSVCVKSRVLTKYSVPPIVGHKAAARRNECRLNRVARTFRLVQVAEMLAGCDDDGRARGRSCFEGGFGEGVKLGSPEWAWGQSEGVGADVISVGVNTDQGLIAKARA